MPIKKCGKFMEKDGIVVKHPGKKFVYPKMPDKMRILYPGACGEAYKAIAQLNALKEYTWRTERKAEYVPMRRLYYFQECVRFVRKISDRIICFAVATTQKPLPIDFYVNRQPTRQHP